VTQHPADQRGLGRAEQQEAARLLGLAVNGAAQRREQFRHRLSLVEDDRGGRVARELERGVVLKAFA